jgi:hypothetical protein
MITLENIMTGDTFIGEELEFFIDDETLIGEVYLDGDLIFQADDMSNEDLLEIEFHKEFHVRTDEDYISDEDEY